MPPPTALAPEQSGLSWFTVPSATGAVRLLLVGELDLATAARARGAVRRAREETDEVVCDLGGIWFVDVSGLRVLLDATEDAPGRFRVVNCPSMIRRMLALLDLEDALDVED